MRNLKSTAIICTVLSTLFCAKAECNDTILTINALNYTPNISSGDFKVPLRGFDRIAKAWEKLHPGVKVEFINTSGTDYRIWMLSQLKGGIAPDIIWTQSEWCNADAKYGWFVPLNKYIDQPNPYIKGNKRWYDTFYTDMTNCKKAPDGTLYALPIDLVETGIFYNKSIFTKAGLQPPKTWAELMSVSQKLQDKGYVPLLFSGDDTHIRWMRYFFLDQLWRDELSKIDVRYNKLGGFPGVDPQEFVRAYKKGIFSFKNPRYYEMLHLIRDWSKYWNSNYASSKDTRLFNTGKAAMYWSGCWSTRIILDDTHRDFDFGIFSLPRITKETSKYASGLEPRGMGGAYGVSFCITESAVKSKKLDLAVDFLRFVTAPQNLGSLVNEGRMALPNSPQCKSDPILAPFTKPLKAGHILFEGEPSSQKYDDQYMRVMQGYLNKQYSSDTVTQMLDSMVKSSTDALIRQNPQWRFDKNWDILPDVAVKTIKVKETRILGGIYAIILLFSGALLVFFIYVAATKELKRLPVYKTCYLFVLPTFLLLLVFNYYPFLSAIYHSLFYWEGGGQTTWIGLNNFKEILSDQVFRESAWNLMKILLASVAISLVVPFIVAEAIFHVKNKTLQYLYRVLFVIPMVVPGIVIILIWTFIYDYNLGLINQLFKSAGIAALCRDWLGDPKYALWATIAVGFPWIGGFPLLVYYAGLQNISTDVLDSCNIDGATGLKRIFYIDLPLIASKVKLLVMLAFIGGIQGFQLQLVMTNGGPGYATMVPGLYLYQNAIGYDRMGYACAIGVVLFLIIMLITFINQKYIGTEEHL